MNKQKSHAFYWNTTRHEGAVLIRLWKKTLLNALNFALCSLLLHMLKQDVKFVVGVVAACPYLLWFETYRHICCIALFGLSPEKSSIAAWLNNFWNCDLIYWHFVVMNIQIVFHEGRITWLWWFSITSILFPSWPQVWNALPPRSPVQIAITEKFA